MSQRICRGLGDHMGCRGVTLHLDGRITLAPAKHPASVKPQHRVWCDECEAERKRRITEQMKGLAARLGL